MNEKTAKKIIEATCSKTLQSAVKKAKFEIADFDLLILAYRNAPDYETKLELLRLIEADTGDEKTKAQAKKCIAHEKAKFERFISLENDCIFEVKIKDSPAAYEERYIAKTFENIHKTIKNFCEHYEVAFTGQTRFTITKRKFTDGMTAESFDEDWRGSANYKGNSVLVEVSHDDLDDRTLLVSDSGCGDNACDECKHEPCFIHKTPKLPPFIKNLDIVCYADCDGIPHYSVFWGDMKTDETDDCAYLIQLYHNALCDKTLKTKDQFFERIFNLHEHIKFPRLEIVKIADVPADIRKTYKTFQRLYNRFHKEQ